MNFMNSPMALAATWADDASIGTPGGGPVPVAEAIRPEPEIPQPKLSSEPLNGNEMALFEVDLDHDTLTESLGASGDPSDPLIPVGELSRLLDLDVVVRVAEGTITGRIGESGAPLTIDLNRSVARIGALDVPIDASSSASSGIDIYIRSSILQRLLPMKITADPDDYRLTIHATEKLPIQARKERKDRLFNLSAGVPTPENDVLWIKSDYRWLGYPAFDRAARDSHLRILRQRLFVVSVVQA